MIVRYVSQRKALLEPTFQLVHTGSSFSLDKNPVAFSAILSLGGSIDIGGQVFSAEVVVVQGAAAPITISGDHLVVLISP